MGKQNEPQESNRQRGRPRSQASRDAIIRTTNKLLASAPIRELTIEEVARNAGVGKATIYRWWDGKCSLVMDAFFESMAPKAVFPQSGNITEDISEHVRSVVRLLRGRSGRIAAEMIGEGQSQPDVLLKFRKRFFSDLLTPAGEAIDHAKKEGQISSNLNTNILLDLIYGPICYRLVVGHLPLDDTFANEIAAHSVRTLQT